MDKFKQEIFEFLAKEENFVFAYEIHDLFPEVKQKLIKDFWEAVNKQLVKLVNDSVWKVGSWDTDTVYPKLGLYLKTDNAEDLRIIYEKIYDTPYYGLWMNEESETLDRERVISRVDKIERLQQRGGYTGYYWIGKEQTNENFHHIRTLKKILPDNNREALVNEYSQLLFEFAESLRDEIEKMSGMKIKD